MAADGRPLLGLIVNPVAGLGGLVGLKGTDGFDALERALEAGATPTSSTRATRTLAAIFAAGCLDGELIVASGPMGAMSAQDAGLPHRVLGLEIGLRTTALDTQRAAKAMRDAGVQLLVFAGGDGTARDVYDAVGTSVPAIGIPTGVKMHSAVFARSPEAAARVVCLQLSRGLEMREMEVMDIDEVAAREGYVSARLHGYLLVPSAPLEVQPAKSPSGRGEGVDLAGIAARFMEEMADGRTYVLGPGTTTRAIADRAGIAKTLLGVDVVRLGQLVARDASERDLLACTRGRTCAIVVSPIGGQGFLLGRGNQQLSGNVIRQIGVAAVVVAATPSKLASFAGRPMLVDTGDPLLDVEFAGYRRVVTGYRSEVVYPVIAA